MRLFECCFQNDFNHYQRYYDTEKQESFIEEIQLKPEYFLIDKNGSRGFFKTLDTNEPLRQYNGFIPKQMKEQNEKPYGFTNPSHRCIRDEYWKKGNFNLEPSIMFLDIETTAFNSVDVENCPEKIVLIQLYETITKRMIILGLEDTNLRTYDFKVDYIKCNSEKHLLETFTKIIHRLKPLFVTAWNGDNFDFIYIYKRMLHNDLDVNKLGLLGKTDLRITKLNNGQLVHKLKAGGIIYMDYLELYKSYTFTPRESYSLDFIASAELNEHKVPHTCYSSFDGFRTGEGFIVKKERPDDEYEGKMWDLHQDKENNIKEIRQLANDYFVHYGIIDTYLLFKLNEKIKLLNILSMISKMTGVSPDEALGRTKPWDRFISNTLYFEGLIGKDTSVVSSQNLKGGYVMEPKAGKHEWIFSVDLSSAYPNLSMRGFNISPETLVPFDEVPEDLKILRDKYFNNEDEVERVELYKSCLDSNGNLIEGSVFDRYSKLLKKYNLVGNPYGTFYRKDKIGIVPRLVGDVLVGRKKAKNKMLDYKAEIEKLKHELEKYVKEIAELSSKADTENVVQLVLKVLANSLYGAMSFATFRFFNIHNARSITMATRFYLHLLKYMVSKGLTEWAKLDNFYDFACYGDTDSCLGISIVNINNKNQTIEDFYNNSVGVEIKKSDFNFIKQLTNEYITPSVNQNIELENKQITYIKKHKVKKRFYKIKVKDKEVTITEDHSIMVVRDNKLIEVKPKDIIKGDNIILL